MSLTDILNARRVLKTGMLCLAGIAIFAVLSSGAVAAENGGEMSTQDALVDDNSVLTNDELVEGGGGTNCTTVEELDEMFDEEDKKELGAEWFAMKFEVYESMKECGPDVPYDYLE